MATLKELLKESYREDMTLADVDKALANLKLVDLSSGKYVDVDKYNKVNDKLASYKDYEEVKSQLTAVTSERDSLVAEKELANNLQVVNKYVKSPFAEFVLSKVEKGENFEKNIQNYVKENPQFSLQQHRIIDSNKYDNSNRNESDVKNENNRIMNNFIRGVDE